MKYQKYQIEIGKKKYIDCMKYRNVGKYSKKKNDKIGNNIHVEFFLF